MKKKNSITLIFVLLFLVAVAVSGCGYNNDKSTDNLPEPVTSAEMDEAEVNTKDFSYNEFNK